ncbi:MAG: hypothetical protein AAF658_13390, partial [Myxococcota bacterium]
HASLKVTDPENAALGLVVSLIPIFIAYTIPFLPTALKYGWRSRFATGGPSQEAVADAAIVFVCYAVIVAQFIFGVLRPLL